MSIHCHHRTPGRSSAPIPGPRRMPRHAVLGGLLSVAILLTPWLVPASEGAELKPSHDVREELSGGEGTVFDTSHNAFGRPMRTMDRFLWNPFRQGKRLFTLPFTTDAEGRGLGPLFNAQSCSGCHFKDGRDGRGQHEPPLLVRLSVPSDDGDLPEPTYGFQLQTSAVAGTLPEGRLDVRHEEISGHYADGTPYTLRRPVYSIEALSRGPLAPATRTSLRMPPALAGVGLLEAIAAADILALADPEDLDGDGISGRPQWVPDPATGGQDLGRFGWKAGQPTLRRQTATALREDLGIDHDVLRTPDDTAPEGTSERAELSRHQVERLTLYTRLLAVPARRNWQDRSVLRGKALFTAAGCHRCHQPRFETADVPDLPALSRQVIRPYTDLLLHDMGDGLADGRREHRADGREWRTAPLWGLGLLTTVSGEVRLLHDGRARSIEEAILWHGGEGQASRDLFVSLSAEERRDLMAFLESL